MKITRRQLRKLIIESMLNEDLYASKEEEEEAIQDFMRLHNISYEEAAKAIKSAGDEMDQNPTWKQSIDLEKEEIKSLEAFSYHAHRGKDLVNYHKLHGVPVDYQGAISDFKMKYLENAKNPKKFRHLNVGEDYIAVQKGYEVYKTITNDEELFSKYYDLLKQMEAQEDKNIFTKDITLGAKLGAIESDVQSSFQKNQADASMKLALAAMSLKAHLEGRKYFNDIKKMRKK